MFDSYVFTDGSARNVVLDDGSAAFQLETLITYYRGIPLSMVHDVVLVVDGIDVPREEVVISPNGDDWFALDEATTVTSYRWEYGTPLYVRRLGALPAGDHQVTLGLQIRVAYIPVPFGGQRTRTVTV
jgi:hypothetical protein